MPANTRIWARRELTRAVNNMESATRHILVVGDVYTQEHPEIAAPLLLATEAIGEVCELLNKTRKSF